MSDLETLAFALRHKALTVREICKLYTISKPTAVTWIARLTTELGLTIETERRRDGLRGPLSKTYKVKA